MAQPTYQFTPVPVTVPADFLGMCYMRYPVSGASPVGTLSWKALRMSQMSDCSWSAIETSAGVYSAAALTALDSIITFQRQNGASVYFGLYGVPTFYAQDAGNPTYGDDITKGPWGALGECSYPNDLTAVSAFVTMIVERYNTAGGAWYDAHFATLGKGIQSWETWNEPGMGAGGNGNTTGSGATSSAFWWGTAAQMVDFAQTQYAAVKAADNTITVTSPGFTNAAAALTFLSTTGGLGETGAGSCDAVAIHPYSHNPVGVSRGTWLNESFVGVAGIQTFRDRLRAYPSHPIWVSEWGVDGNGFGATVEAWYAADATVRYTHIARVLMFFAGMGVKCFHPWHWLQTTQDQGNSGWWQGDTEGVIAAYNDFADKVSGKTITSGTFQYQGPVTLNFSDDTSWAV